MKVIFPVLDIQRDHRNRSQEFNVLWKITVLRDRGRFGLDVYEVESYCHEAVYLTEKYLQLTDDPFRPFVGAFTEGVLNHVLNLCSDGEEFRFHMNSSPQHLEAIVLHVDGYILEAEEYRDVRYPDGYQPQLSINF
jgi:hypothetical protein